MQNGQTVDLEALGVSPGEQMRIVTYAEEESKQISDKLALPPLLEKRRLECRMVDKVFKASAVFDRILVYQIDEQLMENSPILRTDATIDTDRYRAARGVIVSAGMRALDILRSNGLDVGHIVRFIANCPYRLEVSLVMGKPVEVLVMNVGDIVASEDLAVAIKDGKLKIVCREKQHLLVDEEGTQWEPLQPWTSDDQP